MLVTFKLSDDTLARLRAEAERRDITLDGVVTDLIMTLPVRPVELKSRKLGFVALGRSTSGRSAADADEILAEGFGRD